MWLTTALFVRAQDDAAAMPFDNPSLAAQLVQVAALGFTCREKEKAYVLWKEFSSWCLHACMPLTFISGASFALQATASGEALLLPDEELRLLDSSPPLCAQARHPLRVALMRILRHRPVSYASPPCSRNGSRFDRGRGGATPFYKYTHICIETPFKLP